MSELERLYQLQIVDSTVDQAAYRKAHLPERAEFDTARAATRAAESQLAANSTRRSELDAQYAALEEAGRVVDAKVARLEGQMRNVVVTREAEAIQREIATLRSERDETDEAGLLLLDENESLSAEVPNIEGAITSARAQESVAAEALRVAEGELVAQVDALKSQRAALLDELSADIVRRYESMRPGFKGVAVAKLQGTRCTGCHLDLSRVEIEAVRAVPTGEVPECPQCARILYLEPR